MSPSQGVLRKHAMRRLSNVVNQLKTCVRYDYNFARFTKSSIKETLDYVDSRTTCAVARKSQGCRNEA